MLGNWMGGLSGGFRGWRGQRPAGQGFGGFGGLSGLGQQARGTLMQRPATLPQAQQTSAMMPAPAASSPLGAPLTSAAGGFPAPQAAQQPATLPMPATQPPATAQSVLGDTRSAMPSQPMPAQHMPSQPMPAQQLNGPPSPYGFVGMSNPLGRPSPLGSVVRR